MGTENTKYYAEDPIIFEQKNDDGTILIRTQREGYDPIEFLLTEKRYNFGVSENITETNPNDVLEKMLNEAYPKIKEVILEYGFTYNEAKSTIFNRILMGYKDEINRAISQKVTGSDRVYTSGFEPSDLLSYLDIR